MISRKSRPVVLLLVMFCLLSQSGLALSVLWEKTIPATGQATPYIFVGADGSVAVGDALAATRKILWYDRSGELIAELETNGQNFVGFAHVSKDNVVTRFLDLSTGVGGMEVFNITEQGSIERTEVETQASGFSGRPFSYPYLIEIKKNEGEFHLKLYDLTSSTAPTIVGDAEIGIEGVNLYVQWKSVVASKYKVQVSDDLIDWEDYTDIMDGTGSTIRISISRSGNENVQYARVVKL